MELSAQDQAALDYHAQGRPGKIEIKSTKPTLTSGQLSLAYSPGVAAPCLRIAENEDEVFRYTAKGNLVGVISNGTAVLGLGAIGPLASKPVMEGKGILFKKFADIDVFDIEINEPTVEGMVRTVKALGPTFGGINLEDIKAPECFEIERTLVEQMDIPVFHDDQHGTAIIATAAFVNALEVVQKDIADIKVVFSGAGAASMACARLFQQIGVPAKNLVMCDSKGVIYHGRKEGMNKLQAGVCPGNQAPHPRGCDQGCERLYRLFGQGHPHSGDGAIHGGPTHYLCHGQPRSGDHPGSGGRRSQGCHYGHREERLPQPGQQRPGVSLHLSRGPGRAGKKD